MFINKLSGNTIMNILITGATGFIGRELCRHLQRSDNSSNRLFVLSRKNSAHVKQCCGEQVEAIEHLKHINQPIDAIINLAGEPIANKRWSTAQKLSIEHSRINITQQLINFIAQADPKPQCLISSSAIGFYGDQGEASVTETTTPHNEFTHQLCQQWEQCALQAEQFGVRVGIVRTGLVVGKSGGFLSKMLLPFKLGLGGRLGNGQQWMSWIHRDDMVAIIDLLMHDNTLRGVFNATAPNPVRNIDFTASLANTLHRPAWLPAPAFALKLLLGEMSRLLLTGQRVQPQRLLKQGFTFKYPQLPEALQASV